MGPKQVKKKTSASRVTGAGTLSERLDRFREDPTADTQLLSAASTSWENAKKSYGFDKSSTSTQNRRNRHREEYEKIIEGIAKLAGINDVDEDLLWGAENIEQNIRQYLDMAAQMVIPRQFGNESIKFRTLVQRRQSMMYWVQKKCNGVETKDMWNASQEALHAAFRLHNVATDPVPKTYLTKYDLVKLIEHDMYNSIDSSVSQQQHLCWLLGFVCGVRPGTIGTARNHPDQFLTWGDISINRTGGQGSNNFKVVIKFRWLKGYRDVESNMKPLTFTCNGPQDPEDVMFSIPHRILAILIDRNYLADYASMNELLNDNKFNIKIKDSAKDQPVVLATGAKGMGLLSTPASCDAISAYVQRCAMDYGLPSGITHYAWRRSAGTRVGDAMGAEKAREFLGHEFGSRTFETSYNQGLVAFDAVAIALGRTRQSNDELLEDSGAVVNRIVQATESQEKWIEQFVRNDDTYKEHDEALQAADLELAQNPDDDDRATAAREARRNLKSVRRSLQRQGRTAFQKVQLELAFDKLDDEEAAKRAADAKLPGEIQQKLLDAAKNARVSFTDEEEDEDLDDQYERFDLNDARTRQRSDTEVNVTVGTMSLTRRDGDVDAATDHFALAASCKTFMEVLVDRKVDKKVAVSCRPCQSDPTVDEAQKAKTYLPGKLKQHLGTDYHSPKSKFLRQFKGNKNKCPFGGCGVKGTGPAILLHVQGGQTQSKEHLIAAANAGLFNRDFDPAMDRQTTKKVRVVDGKAGAVTQDDPDDIEFSSLVQPRNLLVNGDLDEKKVEAKKNPGKSAVKDLSIRLPTVKPITTTGLWKEYDSDIYGDAARLLQDQRKFIMGKIDTNLRELGVGQALETGETRKQPAKGKGKRRLVGMALLRDRLENEYQWSWAADDEDPPQEGEDDGEDEEFEGFGDE